MTHSLSAPKQPVLLALALGTLGGAALVVTTVLTTRGPLILLPYSALVLASLVAVRLAGWAAFHERFVASFLAFMVATVVLYVSVEATAGEPLPDLTAWGHMWRLGLMAVVGSVLSAAVSYVADLGRPVRGSEHAEGIPPTRHA